MSWDRKGDRRIKYIKRKKSKSNTKSKNLKIKKEELKYKEDSDDLNRYT